MLIDRWNWFVVSLVALVAGSSLAADPPPPTKWTPVVWADSGLERGDHIYRKLNDPLDSVGIEVADAPLRDVAEFIRDQYDIQIHLDLTALDDLGLSPDDPITANIRNVSLGAALNLMLKPHDLAYVVADEVLLITSEDEALTRMVVAVYPVGDILAAKSDEDRNDESRHQSENMDTLIDTIVCCVAPDTWIENGGLEVDIRSIQPGLLVVSQTHDVHRQVADLLKAIRVAKEHACAVPHCEGSERPFAGGLGGEESSHNSQHEVDQGGGIF